MGQSAIELVQETCSLSLQFNFLSGDTTETMFMFKRATAVYYAINGNAVAFRSTFGTE